MKKLFLSWLLVISISTTILTGSEYNEFKNIMFRNEIDLDSKSLKGWIRLFNSKEKINNYGYTITEYERNIILIELKKQKNESIQKYKRGVE